MVTGNQAEFLAAVSVGKPRFPGRRNLSFRLPVVTGMIRAKIIRRPLREAISRGFSALREIRAKGG